MTHPADRPPTPVALAESDRFLAAREPVIAVEVGGQARAYPIEILVSPGLAMCTSGLLNPSGDSVPLPAARTGCGAGAASSGAPPASVAALAGMPVASVATP